MTNNHHPSSFRDPASFVFVQAKKIYRNIKSRYKNEMDHLMNSGLYDELTAKKYLIKHTIINEDVNNNLIIQPDEIEFISYPYEWSFDQIKDAALLTLKIQNIAIKYGMSLKDASIYNIQFQEGRPILIDTTSFEFYDEKPWKAYYQFCKHFLYPLWVLKYTSPALHGLYLSNLDGLTPNITRRLLPFKAYFKLSVILHLLIPLILPSKPANTNSDSFSKNNLKKLLKHLFSSIANLKLTKQNSIWNQYYNNKITNPAYLLSKEMIFQGFWSKITPGLVLDLGANDGHFSRLIPQSNNIISTDFDALVVNDNYANNKKNNHTNILPLILDLCNPSPGIGWNNEERTDFFERKKFDTIIALALVHHLVFSNNITLEMIAQKFSNVKKYLIIEFIPFNDEKVQQIIQNRDIAHIQYSMEYFEKCFGIYFILTSKCNVSSSDRILYLYERKT
jgi:SAM-dependent methyltransferase